MYHLLIAVALFTAPLVNAGVIQQTHHSIIEQPGARTVVATAGVGGRLVKVDVPIDSLVNRVIQYVDQQQHHAQPVQVVSAPQVVVPSPHNFVRAAPLVHFHAAHHLQVVQPVQHTVVAQPHVHLAQNLQVAAPIFLRLKTSPPIVQQEQEPVFVQQEIDQRPIIQEEGPVIVSQQPDCPEQGPEIIEQRPVIITEQRPIPEPPVIVEQRPVWLPQPERPVIEERPFFFSQQPEPPVIYHQTPTVVIDTTDDCPEPAPEPVPEFEQRPIFVEQRPSVVPTFNPRPEQPIIISQRPEQPVIEQRPVIVTQQHEELNDPLITAGHGHVHLHDNQHAADIINGVPHIDDHNHGHGARLITNGVGSHSVDHGDHMHSTSDLNHLHSRASLIRDPTGFYARLDRMITRDTPLLVNMDRWNHGYHHHRYA